MTIEHAGETFQARARTAEEPDGPAGSTCKAAQMSFFNGYRKRVMSAPDPVVVFERLD